MQLEDYQIGKMYVLFLERWEYRGRSGWNVSGPPFTRINVDVAGPEAPWTSAVRHYTKVAALNDYEREKVALKELRQKAAGKQEGYPVALAVDIDRHFKKATSAKSFPDLKAIYESAESDNDDREMVLWSCARGKKQDAGQFVQELFKSGAWRKSILAACACVGELKLTECRDILADAFFKQARGYEQDHMMYALMNICNREQTPLMIRALEAATEDQVATLANWFVENPSEAALDVFRKRVNGKYDEKWELALAMAKAGDLDVVKWAKEFARTPGDKQWMAYYVFAYSPLSEADALASGVISKGDSESLVNLVQGYEESKNENKLKRLQEVVEVKEKGQKLNYWLRRTLESIANGGDKRAEELLPKVPYVESEGKE